MKRFLSFAALALSLAAIAPSLALADDPLSTVKADIAQLQADVQTKHDTVLADATSSRTTRTAWSAPTRQPRRPRSRPT